MYSPIQDVKCEVSLNPVPSNGGSASPVSTPPLRAPFRGPFPFFSSLNGTPEKFESEIHEKKAKSGKGWALRLRVECSSLVNFNKTSPSNKVKEGVYVNSLRNAHFQNPMLGMIIQSRINISQFFCAALYRT